MAAGKVGPHLAWLLPPVLEHRGHLGLETELLLVNRVGPSLCSAPQVTLDEHQSERLSSQPAFPLENKSLRHGLTCSSFVLGTRESKTEEGNATRLHPQVGPSHGQVGLDLARHALFPVGQGLIRKGVRPSYFWVTNGQMLGGFQQVFRFEIGEAPR